MNKQYNSTVCRERLQKDETCMYFFFFLSQRVWVQLINHLSSWLSQHCHNILSLIWSKPNYITSINRSLKTSSHATSKEWWKMKVCFAFAISFTVFYCKSTAYHRESNQKDVWLCEIRGDLGQKKHFYCNKDFFLTNKSLMKQLYTKIKMWWK